MGGISVPVFWLGLALMLVFAFHLRESQCPYCQAVLSDLAARDDDARNAALTDLRDRLLRSTAAALRRTRA